MRADHPDHHVVVIGAGFSGIGAAVGLAKAGFDDFLMIESGSGFGGTWYWNRYPGISVDIPSFSYQYDFAKRSTWSRVYAPGRELRQYAEDIASEYRLHEKVRFGTKVTRATWDEDQHLWTLETDGGDSLRARHVIDASGVLTLPKKPDIEGVDTFAGTTLHTARWDHSVDLTGKRVAVIGTGASAVQLIPSIAEQVEHLTVFQRTPIWCMPKLDAPLDGKLRWAMKHVPGVLGATRVLSQSIVELTFPLAAHYHRRYKLGSFFEKQARAYLAQQVKDPATREKLTPKYSLGCKRPSFHNQYLATFNRPDVTLETDPIARITPHGITTGSGTDHNVDVLVLATGFKVFDPGNFPKYPVTGVAGADLERFWAEHRYQAYEGVSIPGFPNYFTMFGPYGYNGSSYFNLVKTSTTHIVRALSHARDRGATKLEVTTQANARYFAEMLRKRTNQIFWQDSCGLANSYYFDPHGDVPLRPSPSLEVQWRSRHYPLTDYGLESLTTTAEPAASLAEG